MSNRRLLGGLTALALASSLAACGGTGGGGGGGGDARTVTVYSADGLATWYKPQFAAFEKKTGIHVDYVEAGSSEVVTRVEKEKSNPKADVLVTLPPFIQQAEKDGMLADLGADTSAVPAADKASSGRWTALVNNYSCFIVNDELTPKPTTWNDLLTGTYKGKLQYSTPGEAGDGTAVLVLLEHIMGKQGALAYLKKLQANNTGPSSSTGKLQPKVANGTLLVANGDVQMNLSSISADKSAFSVFFPALSGQKPQTVALPYDVGRTSNAPHSKNAEQLIDFLLSTGAQQAISSSSYGLPVRSDVTPTDANYATFQKALAGVTVYHPDWTAVLTGLDSLVTSYDNAVGI